MPAHGARDPHAADAALGVPSAARGDAVPKEPRTPAADPAAAGAAAPPQEPDDAELGPALSVAGAARGLGVAAATLRSWERRYGLAPSLHTKGGHRRYGPTDLARLQVMHRLVREGVPPAEAARVAIRTRIGPEQAAVSGPYSALLAGPADEHGTPAAGALAGVHDEVAGVGSSGGGHVLPMPRRTRSARGLARAAMALDSHACHRAVEASLAASGTVATWEDLIRPVLAAVGDKWAETGRGIEVEHSFSVVVAGAMAAHTARLSRPRNDRPVLLASVADELHDLPLVALQAALADAQVRSHVIGARTPDDALAAAVQRLGPPVVFLWSQMRPVQPPPLPPMRPMPVLIAGGPGWPEDLPEEVVHVADMAGGVEAIRAAMGL
ncbi:MAG: MerR family transcriptional regulator [Candidatus Nanopelagicales bacterium]|nr:MerR family transcriptional regulator [Candidatus Nanopelagicales bacterium]